MSPASIESAQIALDEARSKIASAEFASALPLLDQAISDVGLEVDQYTEAVLLRSQCYSYAEKFELAQDDIDEAELGAPDEGLLHLTKSILLAKQGKTAESKRELKIAKRINPNAKLP